jgi:hypothetical protein
MWRRLPSWSEYILTGRVVLGFRGPLSIVVCWYILPTWLFHLPSSRVAWSLDSWLWVALHYILVRTTYILQLIDFCRFGYLKLFWYKNVISPLQSYFIKILYMKFCIILTSIVVLSDFGFRYIPRKSLWYIALCYVQYKYSLCHAFHIRKNMISILYLM